MFLCLHENLLQLSRLCNYIFLNHACYFSKDRTLHNLNNFRERLQLTSEDILTSWWGRGTLKSRALVFVLMIKPMQVLIWMQHWNLTFSCFNFLLSWSLSCIRLNNALKFLPFTCSHDPHIVFQGGGMPARVYCAIVQVFVFYLCKTSVIKINSKTFWRCVSSGT
jgi:hypothetical protein